MPETETRAAHAGVVQLGQIGIVGFSKHQRVGAGAVVRPHRRQVVAFEDVEHLEDGEGELFTGMVDIVRRVEIVFSQRQP